MKKILLLLLAFPGIVYAEQTKTTFNPFTGKMDYITALSTMSIKAGSNITVTTTTSGVTIAATASGGSGGSPLEVFSQFDGVSSSPTLSIAVGDSLSLSAADSTATINVDLSAVADGFIPYDNGGVFGESDIHYDDSASSFTVTGELVIDVPSVAAGVGANRSSLKFIPTSNVPALHLKSYNLSATEAGLEFYDSSDNNYGDLHFAPQPTGNFRVRQSSYTAGSVTTRWSIARHTGVHLFADRLGNTVFQIEPEVGNSSFTIPVHLSTITATKRAVFETANLILPFSSTISLTNNATGQFGLEWSKDRLVLMGGSGSTGGISKSTFVAIPLLNQKDWTLIEPDQIFTVTSTVPAFAVDSVNYPSGINIRKIELVTSENSSCSYGIYRSTDPTLGWTLIDAIATSSSHIQTETTISNSEVGVGNYISTVIDNCNVSWAKLAVWFYGK